LPRLQQILDKYKSQGFSVVTVNVTASEDSDAVAIIRKYGFTSLSTQDKTVATTYGLSTYLLDSSGRVIFSKVPAYSALDQRAMEEKIRLILARDAARKSAGQGDASVRQQLSRRQH
jgi:hypothetical protein